MELAVEWLRYDMESNWPSPTFIVWTIDGVQYIEPKIGSSVFREFALMDSDSRA
jgi:hypothetical protein